MPTSLDSTAPGDCFGNGWSVSGFESCEMRKCKRDRLMGWTEGRE